MTTYKGINGFAVQSVASDPSPLDEGQVWYNNATYAFKLAAVTTAGTWAAGGNLNTARNFAGGGGTQTANVIFGGSTPSNTGATELYNGTSWTSNPTGLNTPRTQLMGAGVQTAAIAIGQGGGNQVENFNGTSWTSNPVSLPYNNRLAGVVGTDTATLVFNGIESFPPMVFARTASWNGSSWTNLPYMGTGRYCLGASGVQTAALGVGGNNGTSNVATVESWNGTSWTAGTNLPAAKSRQGSAGTQTSALSFGGADIGGNYVGTTELWNGTSWTANPNNMGTSRNAFANILNQAPQSAAIGAGGYTGSVSALTEEFTGAGSPVTKTITTS